jgi:hypothetical protein
MSATFFDNLYTYSFSRDTTGHEEYPPLVAAYGIPPVGKIG